MVVCQDQGVVSKRVGAAVKGMLAAAGPACLVVGTADVPLTAAHLGFIAASVITAGVAPVVDRFKKNVFVN